ncbi:hypothetical protein [Mitsuaria sp. 7]|uniref:hypothetical protein n=1 Tax=Mitsuaria sp. 7 TaxID=1658665 RepID=UPI0018D41B6C|nr:hypothetical protein [Mitsuaria sp. 7]
MSLAAVLRSLPLPWPWQAAPARVMRPVATPLEQRLAPGQSLMLKLARGTVMHVEAGVVDVEDAPALWADQCWPQARRFRSGEVWVVPRTGWWRLEGRVSRDPACRLSARPPAARRSHRPPPY